MKEVKEILFSPKNADTILIEEDKKGSSVAF